MISEDYEAPAMDRYSAELWAVIHRRFTRGPLPIPGQYTTVLGTEMKPYQLMLYGSGYVATRTVLASGAIETLLIPIKSTTIEAYGPGAATGDHQAGVAYTIGASEGVHYPGKGIVTWISGWSLWD